MHYKLNLQHKYNVEEQNLSSMHYEVQSYPGYPYLGYPKPRLSERSSERGVCVKNWYSH